MSGIGTVVCGKIESGVIMEGSFVTLAPSGLTAEVKSIEIFKKTVSIDPVLLHMDYAPIPTFCLLRPASGGSGPGR